MCKKQYRESVSLVYKLDTENWVSVEVELGIGRKVDHDGVGTWTLTGVYWHWLYPA